MNNINSSILVSDVPSEIPDITIPEIFKDSLTKLMPLLAESLKAEGLEHVIATGTYPLHGLDESLNVPLFFSRWICEFNDVIENLNIVLYDLRRLPDFHKYSQGSPKKRFYLLIRTYFHEFYRFRESFRRGIRELEVCNFIDKHEADLARKSLHDAFSGMLEMRNRLVHGMSPAWTGKAHFNLHLVDLGWRQGMVYKHCEDEEIWTFQKVLKNLCSDKANLMRDEGIRMSTILNNLIHAYSEAAQNRGY